MLDTVQPMVMAIREELMGYFKGGCVDRLVCNSSVEIHYTQQQRGMRRSERWQREFKRPAILLMSSTPLLGLSQEPDTVVFFTGVMHRSPQFREIESELRKFLRRTCQVRL